MTTQKLVIITGLSGSGMSSYLSALEDIGFDTVDNIPLRLIDPLIEQPEIINPRPIAICIDARSRGFNVQNYLTKISTLRAQKDLDVRLVYLYADKDVLNKRYAENGRAHPMGHDVPIDDAINAEINLITPLRAQSDIQIDTSYTSVKELRAMARTEFSSQTAQSFTVYIQTFGAKHGNPRNTDMYLTVRHLRNPHYEADLRDLTGLDKPVQDFVKADPDYEATFEHAMGLLNYTLPRLRDGETRHSFIIGIGCTGGKHRSVTFAEHVSEALIKQGYTVQIQHAHIDRGPVYHAPLKPSR